MFDASHQYRQDELNPDVFNAGSGAGGNIANYNGRAVKVGNNGNGTRSLSDLGDWGTYNTTQTNNTNQAAASAKQDSMFAQDKNDITDFLGRYKTGVQGAIDSTSSKYQLPQQLDLVGALNNRIQTLTNNTDNSGVGGYASGQQVDAAINQRYIPQYTTAMTNLNNSAGIAGQERDAQIAPYTTEASLLNDRMARELTGFTSEQQRELDKYVAQLQSNTALTQTQMQAANALAVAQKQYQATIDAQKLQNQNVIIPNYTGSGTYYNPATGSAYNPFVK